MECPLAMWRAPQWRSSIRHVQQEMPATADTASCSCDTACARALLLCPQKITTLEKEKNKEEEYRNYMQLERVRP
jgi:TPP-dependent indolepyruvate ferredoxin oxidoreductase alpha subunit